MATNRVEAAVAEAEAAPGKKAEESAEAAAPAKSGGGGIGAWLPLIITVVLMPALAYVMTAFVLLPKMQKAVNAAAGAAAGTTEAVAETAPAAGETSGHGEAAAPAKGKEKEKEPAKGGKEKPAATPGGKVTVPLNKMLVNVAGSMGTRYLLCSLSLASTTADFQATIEANQAQLTDLASGILASKTIADLEKPGARNLIRSELMTVFNNTLGASVVQEIYFTDFAIQ